MNVFSLYVWLRIFFSIFILYTTMHLISHYQHMFENPLARFSLNEWVSEILRLVPAGTVQILENTVLFGFFSSSLKKIFVQHFAQYTNLNYVVESHSCCEKYVTELWCSEKLFQYQKWLALLDKVSIFKIRGWWSHAPDALLTPPNSLTRPSHWVLWYQ